LVRKNGNFISDYDKDQFGMSIPDLFPYGRGHPGTSRLVPVSLEGCCLHYTRLSRRRLAQHPTFITTTFGVCGRRRVAMSTSVSSRCREQQFESMGSVTRSELAMALQQQKKQKICYLSGRKCHVKKGSSKANVLLRNVRVSQGKNVGLC